MTQVLVFEFPPTGPFGTAAAEAYVGEHTEQLGGFDITDITATSYQVNEELPLADHALLNR